MNKRQQHQPLVIQGTAEQVMEFVHELTNAPVRVQELLHKYTSLQPMTTMEMSDLVFFLEHTRQKLGGPPTSPVQLYGGTPCE